MKNKFICTSPSKTILDDEIVGGVNYTSVVNSDTDLQVGDCVSSQITFTTTYGNLTENSVLTYYVQFSIESTFKQIGVYYIEKINRYKDKYTITAYDCISKLDTPCDEWLATQTTATTIFDLFKSVITHYGLSYYNTIALPANSTMPCTPSNLASSGITGRQVLKYIAQAAGAFIKANTANQVMAMYWGEYSSSTVIDSSKYANLDIADKPAPTITKVSVQSDAGVITYGSGSVVLELGYNPLFNEMNASTTQTYLTAIYNRVHGYGSYYAATFNMFNDYDVNTGDIVLINNNKVLVMTKEISSSGCSISCTGDTTRATSNAITDNSGKLSATTGQIGLMNSTDSTFTFRGQNSTAGLQMEINDADTIPQFQYYLSGAPNQNVYQLITTASGLSVGRLGSGWKMQRASTGQWESINDWLDELDQQLQAIQERLGMK